MNNKKSYWTIIKEKFARNLLLALMSVGGIILIIVDLSKNFMTSEVAILVTIITSLISFITFLLPILEHSFANFSRSIDNDERSKLVELIHKSNKKADRQNEVSTFTVPFDMLYVIANCIHKCPERLVDKESDCKTEYYIYTLSASYFDIYLDLMSVYLSKIVLKIIEDKRKISEKDEVFYLIVPNGRNVLLAQKVSKVLGIPLLESTIGHLNNDVGGVIDSSEDLYEHFYQKFYGVESLLDHIKFEVLRGKKDIELNGIIVDDNISRGTLFTNIALFYKSLGNEGLAKLGHAFELEMQKNHLDAKINVSCLEYSASLFMAFSNYHNKACELFERNSLKLLYYFELSEQCKHDIYQNKDIFKPSYEIQNTEIINKIIEDCKFAYYNKKEDVYKAIQMLKRNKK